MKTAPLPEDETETAGTETPGGGRPNSILAETAARGYLETLGILDGSAGAIILKIPLDEIRRKGRDFQRAVKAGATIGPGTLVDALLKGFEISQPKGSPVNRVFPTGSTRWFLVACDSCGVEDVRQSLSLQKLEGTTPTCRMCYGRARVVRELAAAEVEITAE